MPLDRTVLAEVIAESVDADDCAESFAFFVEDEVYFEDGKFVSTLKSLPPQIRALYLAYYAKTCIDGDGFKSFLARLNDSELLDQTQEAFRMIGCPEAAISLSGARTMFLGDTEAQKGITEPDARALHGVFFAATETAYAQIGTYILAHQNSLLADGVANYPNP